MEGLIGVLIGSLISIIIFRIDRKDRLKLAAADRKDKYRMVAFEKRLDVHQQAFSLWRDLRDIIHEKNDSKRAQIIENAYTFWFNNALYLENSTRDNFYKVITLVANYQIQLENLRNEVVPSERTELSKQVKKDWEEIFELPKTIMKDVALQPFNITDKKDAFGN